MKTGNLLYIFIIIFLGVPYLDFYPGLSDSWIYISVIVGLALFLIRILRGDD
ncbi:MAG TPA: hypothetical protein VGH64_15990 [Puia sp.]